MALDVTSQVHASLGRSFCTSQGALPNTGGAEVWQGYYQSARLTRGKMMINLDLSATAFYEGGSLVQIDLRSPDDLRRGLSGRNHHAVETTIRNLKIRDNHRTGNKELSINPFIPYVIIRNVYLSLEVRILKN
ncbi:unnamed protein product [Rhizophagus irregularis]|nr:unnamed protein product [Rhizophagus irregularis]